MKCVGSPYFIRHGVAKVWVIDLQGQAVEVCCGPGPEGYVERRRVAEGAVTPALAPGLAIHLAALMG